MDPGLEFKVAMEEAELLRAKVVYGDADQDRTMRRISESLSVQADIPSALPLHQQLFRDIHRILLLIIGLQ